MAKDHTAERLKQRLHRWEAYNSPGGAARPPAPALTARAEEPKEPEAPAVAPEGRAAAPRPEDAAIAGDVYSPEGDLLLAAEEYDDTTPPPRRNAPPPPRIPAEPPLPPPSPAQLRRAAYEPKTAFPSGREATVVLMMVLTAACVVLFFLAREF